jgi:hypothetical protein
VQSSAKVPPVAVEGGGAPTKATSKGASRGARSDNKG